MAVFDVNRENYQSKEAERAGSIPDEVLQKIQRALIGIVTRSGDFQTARMPAAAVAEGESVLVVTGRVTDYKEGNRMARMFVGFGAGKQKFEVECVLKDRSTGDVIAKETILDRKWAGFGGGSEEKGMEDFAEKLQEFIKKTVNPEK